MTFKSSRHLHFTYSYCFSLIGYIGEFEEVDDHRSGKIVIQLNGRFVYTYFLWKGGKKIIKGQVANCYYFSFAINSLNKCGVISPRYPVQLRELENWSVQLLPSRQFGYVVLTTSAGIMDHEEARRKHVSGMLLGFFY